MPLNSGAAAAGWAFSDSSKARRRVSDLDTPQRLASRSRRAAVAGSKATVVRTVKAAMTGEN